MKIWAYKIRKNFRAIGFRYHKIMKTVEISLYHYNIIIIWGKDE